MQPIRPVAIAVLAATLSFATAAAHAVGTLVDVTVVDRATGQALPVWSSNGRWYVAGRPGASYELRLRNQSGRDVLAVTSVDGVNVVSGETAAPSQTGYVLMQGGQFAIRGWRKDLSRVAAFHFTPLDDAYATRTGRPDDVGVIGVAVFARKWAPPPPPPVAISRDEGSRNAQAESASRERRAAPYDGAPAASARADAAPAPAEKSLGTGHGRIETSVVRNVVFERESDVPNEVISIWYDSFDNLVARGVAPRPAPRNPEPFPARFVPDPPAR
jgi:hypothetical protein